MKIDHLWKQWNQCDRRYTGWVNALLLWGLSLTIACIRFPAEMAGLLAMLLVVQAFFLPGLLLGRLGGSAANGKPMGAFIRLMQFQTGLWFAAFGSVLVRGWTACLFDYAIYQEIAWINTAVFAIPAGARWFRAAFTTERIVAGITLLYFLALYGSLTLFRFPGKEGWILNVSSAIPLMCTVALLELLLPRFKARRVQQTVD